MGQYYWGEQNNTYPSKIGLAELFNLDTDGTLFGNPDGSLRFNQNIQISTYKVVGEAMIYGRTAFNGNEVRGTFRVLRVKLP